MKHKLLIFNNIPSIIINYEEYKYYLYNTEYVEIIYKSNKMILMRMDKRVWEKTIFRNWTHLKSFFIKKQYET